jgi:hypothetical protein
MNAAALATDAFGRVHEVVHQVVEGLDDEQLAHRVSADANSIAWLVWHLTRIEDDHVAALAGAHQRWMEDGWDERFALPLSSHDTGYGHTSEEVASVRAPGNLLLGYHDAVHVTTLAWLEGVHDADLDRVVDRSWTPPVTAGVRLVSVIADTLQHAGQAAYVRGLILDRQ